MRYHWGLAVGHHYSHGTDTEHNLDLELSGCEALERPLPREEIAHMPNEQVAVEIGEDIVPDVDQEMELCQDEEDEDWDDAEESCNELEQLDESDDLDDCMDDI